MNSQAAMVQVWRSLHCWQVQIYNPARSAYSNDKSSFDLDARNVQLARWRFKKWLNARANRIDCWCRRRALKSRQSSGDDARWMRFKAKIHAEIQKCTISISSFHSLYPLIFEFLMLSQLQKLQTNITLVIICSQRILGSSQFRCGKTCSTSQVIIFIYYLRPPFKREKHHELF